MTDIQNQSGTDPTMQAVDDILQNAPQSVIERAAITPVSQYAQAKERLDKVREYYNNKTLIPNEDYGVIPGTGANSKPTLLKPGAQKLCALFDLASEIKATNPEINDQFISYEVTVTLRNKQTGGLEAEGVGMCNSNERRYKNQDKFNVANTLLKMAKKRALVDATLDALGISSLFTQDIEDMDLSEEAPRQQPQQRGQNSAPPQNRSQQNVPPRAQAAQAQVSAPTPPPPHIVKLQGAMQQVGIQYNQKTSPAWLKAINTYLNETGDSPAITKLRDLTPETAADVIEGITEGLVIVQIENTETVPA